MHKTEPTELTDCISAKQLLQALNTLQQISTQSINDLQLSFSQSSHSFFNTANQGQMNFELYMELKKNNKNHKKQNKNDKGVKKIEQQTQRKSLNTFKKKPNNTIQPTSKLTTPQPNKQKTPTKLPKPLKQQPTSIKQFKSRSHSPFDNKTQQMHTSTNSINTTSIINKKQNKPITPTKSILSTSSVMLSSHNFDHSNNNNNNNKKAKENKQNVCQVQDQVGVSVKVLDYSKKILVERQKKGKVYVPIQDRTTQLIKQKHEKIAKLQRASLAQKQIQQRQCTFKPSINNPKKSQTNRPQPPQNRHRTHTTIDQLTQQSVSRIDHSSTIRQYNDCQSLEKYRGSHQTTRINNGKSPKQLDCGKNGARFNIMLDLIN